MDGELFSAALTLTINSGSDVAKETTVIPITNLEILNFNDSATEDLTINSPPMTRKRKPKKMKIIFIYLIIILEFFIKNCNMIWMAKVRFGCIYFSIINFFTKPFPCFFFSITIKKF